MRQALEMALEALVLNNAEWKALADSGDAGFWLAEEQDFYKQAEQAITAIKEALAQPEQEPVAWLYIEPSNPHLNVHYDNVDVSQFPHDEWFPVYKSQKHRTWVDLTDDEMLMIYGQNHEGKKYNLGRMVQQALKEKNNG